MSVTVKDVLSLDLFKDAIVIAGKNGLSNVVKRINFTDCPFPNNILDCGLVEKGDLFINSLYIAKEDNEKLFEFFKYFVICESAGTFIITEFLNSLPEQIIDFCNENNFPAVFIDRDMPYAEIIKTTMEMIIADQLNTIFEMKIEKLLENNISQKMVIETANEINTNFKKHYAALYIKNTVVSEAKKQILFSQIKKVSNIEPVKYKNGIFLIMNFDKLHSFNDELNYIESVISSYIEDYNIGVSNIFSNINQFNICIKQSILAYDISNIIKDTTVLYKDLNVYKILYPLKDTETLKDFYDDIISPLIEHDSNYDKFELIKTIEAYFNNDGDFKKTALYLNQHENTVRYRILKAKRILNLENDNFKFIEQVSIALKIKNILDIKL